MPEALGLHDVSRVLNLSLDEVLEFVSLGYLPPLHAGEAQNYTFRLREVRTFAERFLGLSADDVASAVEKLHGPAAPAAPQEAALEGVVTKDAAELTRGGAITFTQHAALVEKLADDARTFTTQYSKYREQVGYRVGQLETLLAEEQRRRTDAEHARVEEAEKNDLLKRKLLEAREALARTETELAIRKHRWWRRFRRPEHTH